MLCECFDPAGQVFDALAKSEPAFAGLSYDTLGLRGAVMAGAATEARA